MERNIYKIGKELFITSDEEIKEEFLTKEIYVIDIQNENIGKLTCKNNFFKGSSKLIEIEWKNKQNIWNYCYIREIILTTDQSLDGVQAIDDEFLEWFVKNPNYEEVEINSVIILKESRDETDYPEFDYYNYEIITPKEDLGYITKLGHVVSDEVIRAIMIPKELFGVKEDCPCTDECMYYLSKQCKHLKEEPKQECMITKIMQMDAKMAYDSLPKQETLEEVAERKFENIGDRLIFEDGAKWQMNKQDNFAVGFAEWSVARALGCDTFTINQDELNIYKKYIDTLNGN